MGHASESLEDRNAGRNEDSRDPDWEVPEENKDSIRNWAKGHLGNVLAKEFSGCILSTSLEPVWF